jgi:addiction module HigA family antidote
MEARASRSSTITEKDLSYMPRTFTMPKNRAPIRPGEILEKEYRIPLGLTQQQFADALGIDRERYSAVATGRRRVTPGTAIRLAKVLGTSVELWLNISAVRYKH